MAKNQNPRSEEGARGNLIAAAVKSLSEVPQARVPRDEWKRMKARDDWERKSRTSTLQVSGRLSPDT
jgi:hypothetical protein